MQTRELLDVITKSSDPTELSHAVDKFFTFFIFIQNRCDVNEHDFDARMDALINLLPNDIEKLRLIIEKIEPLAYHRKKHNIFCASLCGAAKGKIHMLSPNYREPSTEIVHIGELAAEIIALHKITLESELTKELKQQIRVEINKQCSEKTEKFAALSENNKTDLVDKIMDRIKGEHQTMITIHHYNNPF